eukprot:6203110-Pleurochrysis_carterae.AAC.9
MLDVSWSWSRRSVHLCHTMTTCSFCISSERALAGDAGGRGVCTVLWKCDASDAEARSARSLARRGGARVARGGSCQEGCGMRCLEIPLS